MTAGVWQRARLAFDLLAVDPGLGGIWLRARAGPVRELLLAGIVARRLDPLLADEALFGGVDLAATLAAGRLVRTGGLIASAPSMLLVPMAERVTPAAAARLARLIEAGFPIIALDEGADPDEAIPAALAERLALHVSLEGCALADCAGSPSAAAAIPLREVALPDGAMVEVTTLSALLGIDSLRAPSLALRAARAAAALAGRRRVEADDLAVAAALVLAPRAVVVAEPAPEPAGEDSTEEADAAPSSRPDSEVMLDAVRAALPADLLLIRGRARRGRGVGTGLKRTGAKRGRPRPARPGRPGGDARIDLIATLRAAVPWQRLRRRAAAGPLVVFRREDLRVKRFEERGSRLVIMAVDASGSTAHARLAEAKGAVEILLGEAYVRRDQVALVAFRGGTAEVLLPPTRSLVQARRRLASLPGGGTTPLAHGLRASLDLAEGARGRGITPSLALLTDGRANVALDGRCDRVAARGDAIALADVLRARAVPGVVIDTGVRPGPQVSLLADRMDADYVALPLANAAGISAAVAQALALGP